MSDISLQPEREGYSAHIELYLITDGEKVRLAQVGPTYAFLAQSDAQLLKPGSAELVIIVDGEMESEPVTVTHVGHHLISFT